MSFPEAISKNYNLILLIVFGLFLLFFTYNFIVLGENLLLNGSMILLSSVFAIKNYKSWKQQSEISA